jgi:hypothetical protein
MKNPYAETEENMQRNWISESEFEKILLEVFPVKKELFWRRFLYNYCYRYYEVYHTDWLDEAFIFIEAELKNTSNRLLFHQDLKRIQEDIRYTQGENSFSLSSIAEAVERLLYPTPITLDCIYKIINLVHFAYSCHMPKEEFLEQEQIYLIERINFTS